MTFIDVKINTKLLEGEAWNKAIGQAQKDIKRRSIAKLKSVSPVKTGFLSNSWSVEGDGLSINIKNAANYSIFQDQGTRYITPVNMVDKSTPSILEDYEDAIIKNLEKL